MCYAIYLENDKMLLENRIFSFFQILPSEFLTFDSSDLVPWYIPQRWAVIIIFCHLRKISLMNT